MAKYIIKNNLPNDIPSPIYKRTAKEARQEFMDIAKTLSEKCPTKMTFRTRLLRGTIQVEIDGFYYYVELYKEG